MFILLVAIQQPLFAQRQQNAGKTNKICKEQQYDLNNRARLEEINTDYLRGTKYYEIPPNTHLNINELKIKTMSSGWCAAETTQAESESYFSQRSDGSKHISYKIKDVTIKLVNSKLVAPHIASWGYGATLTHEPGDAYFDTCYPLMYAPNGDKKIHERYALTVEFRWIIDHVPDITEKGFLQNHPLDYRLAYLYFKNITCETVMLIGKISTK